MGLSAGMWTGVSGLLMHGERMSVLGNNIANVSTVGFKSQRMDFEDFIYQNSFSAAGPTQIGRGVTVGAVFGDFSQGSFETTNDPTDLAIGGRGFFQVRPKGSEVEYFTRAGNFRFDNEGYLVDPHGYALQGWKVDNTSGPVRASGGTVPVSGTTNQIMGSGVPQDVKLDTWTVAPLQTTKLSFELNLSSDKGADKSANITNPFAGLVETWNGTQPPIPNRPSMPEDAYSFQTSIKVYDEAGASHTLTVYFDQINKEHYEGGSNEKMWEYIVTMDPSEDARRVCNPGNPGATPPVPASYVDMKNTKAGGLLMAGTLTFDGQGQLANQSAYTLNGTNKPLVDPVTGKMIDGNGYHIEKTPDNLDGYAVPDLDFANVANSLIPTEVSSSGFPMLVANFTGVAGANTAGSVPDADSYLMEIDFGLKVSDFSNPWRNSTSSLGSLGKTPVTNLLYDPAHPEYGPAQYSAIDRVKNPNYNAANPASGPEYVYENPNWKPTDKDSPQYYYDTATPGAPPVFNPAPTLDPVSGAYTWPTGNATAASDPPNMNDVSNIKPPVMRQDNAFTNYPGAHNMANRSQNGYGYGNLSSYNVDQDGILSGVYSNGVTLPLYQVTMYDFSCTQGLRREGGNLFSQTRDSGYPSSGAAGVSGMGKVNAYSLEQSNVDLSREFVNMITTQRGFQSNSKIVTTTDSMLEVVVNMKR